MTGPVIFSRLAEVRVHRVDPRCVSYAEFGTYGKTVAEQQRERITIRPTHHERRSSRRTCSSTLVIPPTAISVGRLSKCQSDSTDLFGELLCQLPIDRHPKP